MMPTLTEIENTEREQARVTGGCQSGLAKCEVTTEHSQWTFPVNGCKDASKFQKICLEMEIRDIDVISGDTVIKTLGWMGCPRGSCGNSNKEKRHENTTLRKQRTREAVTDIGRESSGQQWKAGHHHSLIIIQHDTLYSLLYLFIAFFTTI